MSQATQEEILERYRAGHHADAFALQLDHEQGRLKDVQQLLLRRSAGAPPAPAALFACGEYHPSRNPNNPGSEILPKLGCTYSEALLRLKDLRPGAAEGPGAAVTGALVAFFAGRLAHALALLRERIARGEGEGGGAGPLSVCVVPSSSAGEPPYGMNRVAREACALAGPGFVLRPLLLRGAGIPKAHLGARARDQETQIRSLMPLRDLSVRFRPLLVVDDIVSSGATLRAAAELLSVYNEAHGRWGLALARTAAQLRDHAKAELLRL